MRDMNYLDALRPLVDKLAHGGVFLNVGGETPNTMTIGWGWIGTCWTHPILVVVVRPQRHTYDLIQELGEFTVSVPTQKSLLKELAFAGTASGRDVNKFEGHGITAAPAQKVNAPIIAECGLHFECKTVNVQDMVSEGMNPDFVRNFYPDGDFHTMFFGEIVACYSTEDEAGE